MFVLLAVLTSVLAIMAGTLAVVGLMRKRWLICLAGAPFAIGAFAAGMAAYQSMPPALVRAFAANSSETATTLSLLAIALSLVAVVGIAAPANR